MFWMATERSIRNTIDSTMKIVEENGFESVAFPAIGAGSGSFNRDRAIEIMSGQLSKNDYCAKIFIVKFEKKH